MASGGDSSDKRGSVSGRSLKDALHEASRLIEDNSPAKVARTALIEAGIGEQHLDLICGKALYYYWHIQTRIQGEPDALKAAQDAYGNARELTDWVNGLTKAMPVIFDIAEGDPYPSLKSDEILDALARVRQRPNYVQISPATPKAAGFTREKGTKGEAAKHAATRRFAVGYLASQIKYAAERRPHNKRVGAIAMALFPGADVSDRVLERGRERALGMLDDRFELWLFPEGVDQ